MSDTREPMAEQSVIGSVLIDPRCWSRVAENLREDDFVMIYNRELFKAMGQLIREDVPLDPVTVKNRAAQNDVLISAEYIAQLMEITPTAANVGEYVKIVKEHTLRRHLADVAVHLDEAGKTAAINPELAIVTAKKELEAIQGREVAETLCSNEAAVLQFSDHRLAMESGTNTMALSSGYQSIDRLLGGGFLNSGLHIIAARPAMGKTAFALNIAHNFRCPGLFVSLEMDVEQITARRLSMISGIAYNRLMLGELDDEENEELATASEKLMQMPNIYVPLAPTATIEEIEIWSSKVPDLGFVIIDYLGKISGGAERKFGLTEEITRISADSKNLARRLKKPVIMLCQLNRELEKRPNKRPNLSDLRDSGAIEQDADTVIFLHRPDYYDKDYKPAPHAPVELQVILAKNRHGNTGDTKVDFYMPNNRIRGIYYASTSSSAPPPPAPPRKNHLQGVEIIQALQELEPQAEQIAMEDTNARN